MLLTETSHFSLRPGDGTGAFGEVKATPWTFQSAPGVPELPAPAVPRDVERGAGLGKSCSPPKYWEAEKDSSAGIFRP